jgi:hypothetical protein
MAKVLQFYDGAGVPLRVEGDVEEPATAWRSQRARVRDWLASVPGSEWTGPTRCDQWDMTGLVRHMVSAAQFLGYTLHEASRGTPTSLLRGFDTQETVQNAAAMLGDLTPDAARDLLAAADTTADGEFPRLRELGWSAIAEAPPGHLRADLALSHFLFDSWVHEHDLMLPRGEQPVVDPLEVEVVVRYLVGLASVVTGARTSLNLRLTEPDLQIGLDVEDGMVEVTVGSAPNGAGAIEGRAADVVDRTTGRVAGAVRGDVRALAVLDDFAGLLAG